MEPVSNQEKQKTQTGCIVNVNSNCGFELVVYLYKFCNQLITLRRQFKEAHIHGQVLQKVLKTWAEDRQ